MSFDSDQIVAVPCQGADELVLLAAATGEHLGSIPVGRHPVHAIVVGTTTFVATMGERAISAIGPDGSVVSISLGVLGPSHFAVLDDLLYVSCTAGDVVGVVDPVDRERTDRIAVGAAPHELVAVPPLDRVFVGTRRAGTVDAIEGSTGTVVNRRSVPGDACVQGVAVNPGYDRLYAIDQRQERVVGFDLDAGPAEPVGIGAVGPDPYELVVTRDRVVVPGRGSGTVHVFDHVLDRVARYDGFSRPVDCFELGGAWWVLDARAPVLRSLDGRTIELDAPGLAATPWDERLVISHYDEHRVSVVDPSTGVEWSQSVAEYPFGAVIV